MRWMGWLRGATLAAMVILSAMAAGCESNPREPEGGGKASGATELGGDVTTASPGGPNVRPNQGTGGGVR